MYAASDEIPTENSDLMIFDAAHMGGNPDFFFLPPLVSDPTNDPEFDVGWFDPTLSPTVEICMVEDNECAPTQPDGFPLVFTGGEGSESVRISPEDELYIVNWHTNISDSWAGGTYRISVLENNALLGFADVFIFNTMKEAKNLDTGESFALVGGRTLPIKFRIEEGATDWRIVGPEGGILVFNSGIVMDVPAGAVDQYVAIRLGELPFSTVQNLLDNRVYRSSEKIVLAAFTAEPHGLVFNVPVKVTLPILPPSGIPMQAEVDLDAQEYWLSPTEMVYDPETSEAEITLTDFSGKVVVDVAGADVELPDGCDEGLIRVVSHSSGFASGNGCQVIGDFVEVTFLSCPGHPTVSVYISETTPECGDDFELTVEIPSQNIEVCRSKTLDATVTDQNGNEWVVPLTWKSHDPLIASIHPVEGKATGNSEGVAVVEAATPDISFYGTGYVFVNPPSPIIILPPASSIKVDDDLPLSALNEAGEEYFCEKRSEDGTVLEKEPVTWSSQNPAVATIDPQTGLVSGISFGIAEIKVEAGDAIGYAEIRVGDPNVDIVFVICTTMEQWCNFPGDGCGGDWPLLPDQELFQTDFTVGLFSYSVHSQICVDPGTWCGIPSGPCYAYRSHGPIDGIHTESEFVDAFYQMRTVCNYTGETYFGTSMYFGLMQAINQYPWRNDAKKAIILVGGYPAGLYRPGTDFVNTYVEPIFNIPRPAVIQAALAKGINIYAINIEADRECSYGLDSLRAICREEHTTLAAATGGNYYPSSQIEFYCYPPDHNNIIQALEDINDSNDHLNILQALEDINDMSDYLKIQI
jgi:hypothetical protein